MKRQRALTVEATADTALGVCDRALTEEGWDVFEREERELSAAESVIALCCLDSPARMRIEVREVPTGRSELTITGRLAGPGSRRIHAIVDRLADRFATELESPRHPT